MQRPIDHERLQASDIDRLAQVDPRLADEGALRAHIVDLLGAGLSWLAVTSGSPAGFAVVTRHFFNFPFVDLLFVSEAHRRRGVGGSLMAHCEAVHDSDRIFTSTNESNEPMRALMASLDWRPCGRVDALDEGDPELFFVKFRPPA